MPDFDSIGEGLRHLREERGLSTAELANRLIIGEGWVELVEAGDFEPPTSLLAAWLSELGTDLATFLPRVDLGQGLAFVRSITAEQDGHDVVLRFRFGRHLAEYRMPGTTVAQFEEFLTGYRNRLATMTKRDAVAASFLDAVARWPGVNPSDLWYFVMSQAYLDPFNHPATEARTNLEQSLKRTGGWALEKVIVDHYNPHLAAHGVRLEIPEQARKLALMAPLQLGADAKPEKADVLAVGTTADADERCFGVVHVKASFAERRNADLALSRALQQRGYASPFVTMDSKASPAEQPVNRGELGAALAAGEADNRGPKRKEIEVEKNFDACFSYNRNTIPTPAGQDAAARIHVCDFTNADDAFAAHLVAAWAARQG